MDFELISSYKPTGDAEQRLEALPPLYSVDEVGDRPRLVTGRLVA